MDLRGLIMDESCNDVNLDRLPGPKIQDHG